MQHDYAIANDSGANVRADINDALGAVLSQNSGASAPSTTAAQMVYADTTKGYYRRRNAADSGWLPFASGASTMVQAKTSAYTVAETDFDTLIDCTSGTFTLTLTAAATLGDGFRFGVRNSGTGIITIDPNLSETIDGATTIKVYPGEAFEVECNGSALKTIGRQTGLVLISSPAAASGAAAIDFTAGISSDFDEYELHLIDLTVATASQGIQFRGSTDGGSTFISTSSYRYAIQGYTDGGSASNLASAAAGAMRLDSAAMTNSTNSKLCGVLRVYQPASGTNTHFDWRLSWQASGGAQVIATGAGRTEALGTLDAFRIMATSGNISGTVRLYGVRK